MAKSEIKAGLNTRNKYVHWYLDKNVDHFATFKLEGEENLDAARELSEDPLNDITFIPNHGSNLDAPGLDRALERFGYPDLESKLVYLLGIKLKNNPGTAPLTYAVDHIPVYPLDTLPKETKEQKVEAIRLTRGTLEAVKEVRKQGRIIVVFAEGTRTRTGKMQQGKEQVSHYISPRKGRNSYVVPIGIDGTFEMYPPGRKLFRSGEVMINVGVPVDVREYENQAEDKQELVDAMMIKVARLIPEEKRGFYASYVV
ncbi:hypothetical protein BH09PAT1_BH09PAT1_6390 [soil metagenome]